jgi:hypothetical protein
MHSTVLYLKHLLRSQVCSVAGWRAAVAPLLRACCSSARAALDVHNGCGYSTFAVQLPAGVFLLDYGAAAGCSPAGMHAHA